MMKSPNEHSPLRAALAAGLFVLEASLPSPALALEPLEIFVASSRHHNLDARESRALLAQRSTETDAAWTKLLPVVGAQATYTRNQYEAIVARGGAPPAVIVPQDQTDVYFTASWAVIDIGQWERIGAARRGEDAAGARARASELDAERSVARAYYQVIATEALKAAATQTLEAAQKNLAFVQARMGAGFAQELDTKRASAEVERGRQLVADTVYQMAIARRSLESESGRTPSPGAPDLVAELVPEAPLAVWEGTNLDALPSVRAAHDEVRAAERTASATRAGLLPTVSLNAQERLTNATGFQDRGSLYALSATAALRFDVSTLVTASAQGAAAEVSRIREARARQQARDRIHAAWQLVRSLTDKAQSARAGLEASRLASRIAQQRYIAGTSTFLDVITAERDVFSAEVARIQADGDLLFARADLRLSAGRSSLAEGKERP